MRWPLRRARRLAQPYPAQPYPAQPYLAEQPQSGREPQPGEPQPAAGASRRGPRDWAHLPPLPTTVALPPPILHDGLLVLPPVGGARPLLRPEPGGAVTRPAHAAGGARAPQDNGAGRGAGPRPGVVPLRSVPVVSRPPRTRPSLTQATDDYVGEPREPADPYRSSAWLRMVSAVKPPWAADADDGTAPAPLPPSPRRPAPKLGGGPRPSADRASLARSRRLGLGRPTSPTVPQPSEPQQLEPSADPGTRSAPWAERPAADPERPTAQVERAGSQPERGAGQPERGAGQPERGAGQPDGPGRASGPADVLTRSARSASDPIARSPELPTEPPAPPTEPTVTPGALLYRAASGSRPGTDRPRPNRRTGMVSAPDGTGQDAGRAAALRPPGATLPPASTPAAPAGTPAGAPSTPALPPRAAGPRPARPLGLAMPTGAAPPSSGTPAARPGRAGPARAPGPPTDAATALVGRPAPSQTTSPQTTPPQTTPPPTTPPPGPSIRPSPGAPVELTGRPGRDAASGPSANATEPAPLPPGAAVLPGAPSELTAAAWAALMPPDIPVPQTRGTLVPPELTIPPLRARPAPPARALDGEGQIPTSPEPATPGPGVSGPAALAPSAPEPGTPVPSVPGRATSVHVTSVHATPATALSTVAAGPPVPMTGLAGLRQAAPDRPPAVLPTRSVYRSVLAPLPPAPARPAERGPALLTHGVPGDIASMFRSMHGVDVSDVRVHRGRVVTEHARDLGARAFTSGQEIYLPDAVGSLDAPQARALLAHELTHAAHQRRLGAALPDESSAGGQVLEAQAVATEHWFLGGQGQDLPLTSLAAAPGSAAPGSTVPGSAAPESTVPGFTGPWSLAPPRPRPADDGSSPALRSRPFPPLQHVQRQPIWATPGGATVSSATTVADLAASGAATLKSLAREHATWSPPAWLGASRNTAPRNTATRNTAPGRTAPGSPMFGDPTLGDTLLGDTLLGETVPEEERAEEDRAAAAMAAATEAMVVGTRGELAELREQLSALAGQRPVGLDDPIALDELATRLYQRLRSRLRLELIVDRERAGLLSDFR